MQLNGYVLVHHPMGLLKESARPTVGGEGCCEIRSFGA